jgi:hypothetical protein
MYDIAIRASATTSGLIGGRSTRLDFQLRALREALERVRQALGR